MLRNFYRLLMMNDALWAFGVWCTTRVKAFTAKVVTVVARWTKGGRRDILTLYTDNKAFEALYAGYTYDYMMNSYVGAELKKMGYAYQLLLRYDPYRKQLRYADEDGFVEIND